MEKIFITVMSWGRGDNRENLIYYVGTDYEKAKKRAFDFVFPDQYNNFGNVQHWENGKLVRDETVRDD